MLTDNQLRYLGLEAAHRAFVLEERCIALERTNQQIATALEEAQALIERLKKGPPAAAGAELAPLPPIVPPPPAEASPDDDGVAASLDAMARAIVAEPA